jgi:hypothetical protein
MLSNAQFQWVYMYSIYPIITKSILLVLQIRKSVSKCFQKISCLDLTNDNEWFKFFIMGLGMPWPRVQANSRLSMIVHDWIPTESNANVQIPRRHLTVGRYLAPWLSHIWQVTISSKESLHTGYSVIDTLFLLQLRIRPCQFNYLFNELDRSHFWKVAN